jgi:hypothetical protein
MIEIEIEEYIKMTEVDRATARTIVKASEFWFELLRLYPAFKSEISLNKSLPDEILKMLSEDGDDNIRLTVAMKRRLPQQVFERLSTDENESVRLAISRNPKTPSYILSRMENDSWGEIRKVIVGRLKEMNPLAIIEGQDLYEEKF